MQNPNNIRICNNCILPETFPGIKFDAEGICNHCQREASFTTKTLSKKAEYRERLDKLIKETRSQAPLYDIIMAYSGGKDSSYTLKLLKERYDVRILAYTFDNHFLSPLAQENIEKILTALGIDLITFKPQWSLMKSIFTTSAREELFPKAALLRASSICTACITIVKSMVLKTALEMNIPLVAFGWSPGQAPIQSAMMKTNPSLIRENQKSVKKIFLENFGQQTQSYFLPDAYFTIYKDHFPYNIHPLAFFDYDEEMIAAELSSMGWEAPTDTDTNSTNCLINAYANQCHLNQYGFHPYVLEIANMVRHKVMSREDGIRKIYSDQNQEMVAYAHKILDI